ncbi:hypothetical protein A0H81_06324 [Grifola frondosa]|uniref:Fungal-type protein kinase domain-containing protein n=1 Tax=Grifola frondosa TaxID=5627 RepID=A0A1C7MAZ5_GRIFR|nr:hypothetical protein A0H81_06324 [Grifola frondosa]
MDSSDSNDELEAEQPRQIRETTPVRTPGMANLARSAATALGGSTKSGVQRKLLAYDMSGKWAKINIRLFLNSMPVKSTRSFKQPDYTNVFNLIPEEEGPEVDLYPKFCDAVMKHKICPGYKFIPCDTKYDMDDKGKNKVDVGLHKMAGAPKDGRPNWINQSMWIEFKKKGNCDDAFNDSEQGPFEVDSTHAAQVRGQLISYAEMAMNRQHRTHLYSVFVMHKFARLIRWDRAGAVVSEKFDYKENPEILGEFFWRFSHMTDEAQGYDRTAQLLSSRTKLFRLMDTMAERVLPEPFDYIRQQFKDSLKGESLKEDDVKVDWPRYKLAVEDKEKGTRYFLVGRCHGQSPDLVGRGTRTYVAIDVETETFIHLKDQWRYASDFLDEEDERRAVVQEDEGEEEMEADVSSLRPGELHLEGDILRHLNKTGVRNVPTVVCHGDVSGQVTFTRDVWRRMPERLRKASKSVDSEGDKRHPPSKLMHYRLVEKEVGKPLSEFTTSSNLVRLIYDCMIAHEDAMKLGRVIHRDISSGNMLMYPIKKKGFTSFVWMGLLNDWEFSKPIAKPGATDVARRAGRTGTWQFMSANILDDKSRPPTIADELESFFYVLVYYGLYLQQWRIHLRRIQAQDDGRRNHPRAGKEKLRFIGIPSHQHPLNTLIETMLSWFQGLYYVANYESELPHTAAQARSPARNQGANLLEDAQYADLWQDYSLDSDDQDDSDSEPVELATRRKAAAHLDSHRAMQKLFLRTLAGPGWPHDDKLGDQLPQDYTSKRTRGSKPDGDAAPTGEKRPREDILAEAHLRKRPRRE